MTANRKALAWKLLTVVGLSVVAWALVWGFATTHPESGVPEKAAIPAMLMVIVIALVYYGARAVLSKKK